MYQKISNTKGNSFQQKIPPPRLCTSDLSKNKGNFFEQKIPPPSILTPDLSKNKGNSFEQKISPPGIRTPDLSTFTANLSKKIHAKNLKIFFKKFFPKKNLFLGYEKKVFLRDFPPEPPAKNEVHAGGSRL